MHAIRPCTLRTLTIWMSCVAILWTAASCRRDPDHARKYIIQLKGSDTMVNLGQAWAEDFMERNPARFVAVTGGGSGTGISSLLNRTCDTAMTSRNI